MLFADTWDKIINCLLLVQLIMSYYKMGLRLKQ